MSEYYQNLIEKLNTRFGDAITGSSVQFGDANIVVARDQLLEVATALRDEADFAFEEVVDLSGVDYSEYGDGAWQGPRFAVAYQMLSIKNNHRLRMKVFADDDMPVVDSVVNIWSSVNWFEREAFDLFGIVFDGHPDLRRILTDYGFIGHPFRKDFPLIGHVEMRYDPDKRRVIYQPVTIEPRINQVRVIRDDHRYSDRMPEES